MSHSHNALADPAILERAKWHYDDPKSRQILALIQRLSKKPYAHEVAAFWAMYQFHLAGPMTWTGEKFEGEATAFIVIRETLKDHLIAVSFCDSKGDTTRTEIGGVNEAEKLVDALVIRILHYPVPPPSRKN